MKLTIDSKVWLRGEGEERSALLRSDGKMMCCVGILALACGWTPEEIRGYKAIAELVENNRELAATKEPSPIDLLYLAAPLKGGTEVAMSLYATNDDKMISDVVRERELTELFALIGVEVEFV